jgi:predicted DCC family thiol-disulfide oxidoreductase YuxK
MERTNAPQVEAGRQVEVFFDGDCPLCMREIRTLRRLDRRERIQFTDIAADGFDATRYGKSQGEFMASIKGRSADGEWLDGVEVFRQLYAAVGLGPLVALTRLPGVSHGLDVGYRVFSRNRLRLTGRCDDACSAPASEPSTSAS